MAYTSLLTSKASGRSGAYEILQYFSMHSATPLVVRPNLILPEPTCADVRPSRIARAVQAVVAALSVSSRSVDRG